MKILVILFVLACSNVFAMPAVGDYAQFATYDGYIKEAEIISFDQTTQSFDVHYTTKFQGMLITDDVKTEKADDMITDEKIEYILAACETFFGGQLEQVGLAMGTFDSCKLTDQDTKESFNVGHVPFGVLAMELVMDAEPDATFKKFTLQKYRLGN